MSKTSIFVPNSSCGPCIYCYGVSEFSPEDLLRCDICKRSAHMTCLKTGVPKTRLLGDNFFKFSCVECSDTGEEKVSRIKLSIVHLLLLTLYNLHLTDENDSKEGYFHYKKHVYAFIEARWKDLFSYDGRTCNESLKIYPNIISGQLSQCSYFISFKTGEGKTRGGWYRLISVVPPTHIIHNFTLDYSRMPKRKVSDLDLGRLESSFKFLKKDEKVVELESEEGKDALSSKDDLTEDSSLDSYEDSRGSWYLGNRDIFSDSVPVNIFDNDEDLKFESKKIGFSKLKPELPPQPSPLIPTPKEVPACVPTTSKEKHQPPPPVFKYSSLFNQSTKKSVQPKKEEKKLAKEEISSKELVPLTLYEERNLLKKLDSMKVLTRDMYYVRRKLIVRQLKREHNLSVFNIDQEYKFLMQNNRLMTEQERLIYSDSPRSLPEKNRILDRYQVPEKPLKPRNFEGMTFRMKLIGAEDFQQTIFSPHTKRTLKPVIWQDFDSTPMKMKLLMEVTERSREKNDDSTPVIRKPINYYYITTKHIPALNHMAREFFWPGIELSEVLQYPDFTVVAMYGQLVIGFGILVPNTKPQEGYISFLFVHPEWRNGGVGKFMLYHLIQTSPGKDITLHVSCTNPALIMYQDFGFKVEEYLINFYDKYLPEDSPECKHAFFIRLHR